MSDQINEPYQISVAPEAVEVGEDHLVFPGGVLLPLSARGSGVPGMPDRPWSRLTADVFYTNLPTIYSLALRREPPDVLRGSLRAKRTLFEGFMLAMAEKTGRRPSMAERSAQTAVVIPPTVVSVTPLSEAIPAPAQEPLRTAFPWWQALVGLIGMMIAIASASVADPRPQAIYHLTESMKQISDSNHLVSFQDGD